MLTLPMEPKSAGAVHAQPAVNPTKQPKPKAPSPNHQPPNLPSDSSKQLNLPSKIPRSPWGEGPSPFSATPTIRRLRGATGILRCHQVRPLVAAPPPVLTPFAKVIVVKNNDCPPRLWSPVRNPLLLSPLPRRIGSVGATGLNGKNKKRRFFSLVCVYSFRGAKYFCESVFSLGAA